MFWYGWRDSNPHCTGFKSVASTYCATSAYKAGAWLSRVTEPHQIVSNQRVYATLQTYYSVTTVNPTVASLLGTQLAVYP